MNTLASIERAGSPIVVAANGAAPTGGSGPVERIALARPVLPCDGCAHLAVCSIRPLIVAADLAFRTPPSPHPDIHVLTTVAVSCDHFLGGEHPAGPPKPSGAARLAENRARGAAGLVAARSVRAANLEARRTGGQPGKRSPEARERMRIAQKAAWERRRAREAQA